MIILSIETSCDDTSIAILRAKGKKTPSFDILTSIVSSQTKIHAPFGGIVPSLAARSHQRNLPIVLQETCRKSKIPPPRQGFGGQANYKSRIDLITVTNGPGLEPSLWAGVNFAKSLALVSNTPILGVNHLHGHLVANLLDTKKINFPALGFVVSGGHTQLILMHDFGKYKLLGETRDDAAGEAFDKVAKLLDLGYPGGPAISAMAEKITNHKRQITNKFQIRLPRPMINSKDYDFSFSGLKTAVLYTIKNLKTINYKLKTNICAEFQQAVIDVLLYKTLRAAKQYEVKSILCGGGVMANKELRRQLKKTVQKELQDISLYIPPIELCTDNAVMTGIAGYYKFLRKGAEKLEKIKADANLKV